MHSKKYFIEKSKNSEKEYEISRKQILNKGVHIDSLAEYAVEVKKIIKLILKLPSWSERHGASVKLIPKQYNRVSLRQQESIEKAAVKH